MLGALFLQNRRMEPPPSPDCEDQGEMRMERTRLANLLNERHPLVKLAQQIDWRSFDEHLTYYSEWDGAARHLHEADGELITPQIHPRPL